MKSRHFRLGAFLRFGEGAPSGRPRAGEGGKSALGGLRTLSLRRCSSCQQARRKAVGAGVRLWAAAGGVCGFLAVALWLYWTQFCADPLVTQGRVQGWDSWPAYVPPLFEGTLLGAGLLTAAGFLKGALLPQWHDWAFECDFFRTDEHGNGYFILLEGGSEGHAAVLAEALHPDACEYVHGKGGRA